LNAVVDTLPIGLKTGGAVETAHGKPLGLVHVQFIHYLKQMIEVHRTVFILKKNPTTTGQLLTFISHNGYGWAVHGANKLNPAIIPHSNGMLRTGVVVLVITALDYA
jgi:uncharacterized membrane protein